MWWILFLFPPLDGEGGPACRVGWGGATSAVVRIAPKDSLFGPSGRPPPLIPPHKGEGEEGLAMTGRVGCTKHHPHPEPVEGWAAPTALKPSWFDKLTMRVWGALRLLTPSPLRGEGWGEGAFARDRWPCPPSCPDIAWTLGSSPREGRRGLVVQFRDVAI